MFKVINSNKKSHLKKRPTINEQNMKYFKNR